MLSSLFIGPTAALVDDVLGDIDGAVAVVGSPKLARALADRGRSVVAVAPEARALKRMRGTAARAAPGSLPVANGAFAALVGVGAGTGDDWEALVREWSRAVADAGTVLLVDRAAATEHTRRALCGGLMDLGQRTAGRVVVTTGRVAKLPEPKQKKTG